MTYSSTPVPELLVSAPELVDSQSSVRVTVLLFAGLREQLGTDRLERVVAAGTTVEALYHACVPARSEGRLPVLYAMDEAYVRASTPVRDGAEVAFLPPLGGG
jgi:molybdopterin converting factor small subunit